MTTIAARASSRRGQYAGRDVREPTMNGVAVAHGVVRFLA
jgi:hypothetical protein